MSYRIEWQRHAEARTEAFDALGEQSVIEAALAAGLSMPRSCRNGTCRACRCRLLSGEIAYRVEWPGLSREEQAEGWILPCVALPRSELRLRHE